MPISEDVKKEVRAVLMSKAEGIPVHSFSHDYKKLFGHTLLWKDLGYSKFKDFLQAMPDVVKIIEEDGKTLIFGKPDGSFMTHTAVKAVKRAERKSVQKNKDGISGPSGDTVDFPELQMNLSGLYCVTFEKRKTHKTNEEIEEEFRRMGEVNDINFGHEKLLFVRYKKRSDAVKALKTLSSTFQGLRPAKEKKSQQDLKESRSKDSTRKTENNKKLQRTGESARMPTNLLKNLKSHTNGIDPNSRSPRSSTGGVHRNGLVNMTPLDMSSNMTLGLLGTAPPLSPMQHQLISDSHPGLQHCIPVNQYSAVGLQQPLLQYGVLNQPGVSRGAGDSLHLATPHQNNPISIAAHMLGLQLNNQVQNSQVPVAAMRSQAGYAASGSKAGYETVLSNISYDATKMEVKLLFTGHHLKDLKLIEQEPHGGFKKMFAFATFFTEEEALRAINDLNGRKFKERSLKMRLKKPNDLPLSVPGQQGEAQIVVANLPESCTKNDIILMTFKRGASNIYMVSEILPTTRYYAIVTVPNAQAAASAIHNLNNTEFNGKILHLNFASKYLEESDISGSTHGQNTAVQPLLTPQEIGDFRQLKKRQSPLGKQTKQSQIARHQVTQELHSNQEKMPLKKEYSSQEKGKGQQNKRREGQIQKGKQKNTRDSERPGKKDDKKTAHQENKVKGRHSHQKEDEEWDAHGDLHSQQQNSKEWHIQVDEKEAMASAMPVATSVAMPVAMPVSPKEEVEIFSYIAVHLGKAEPLPEVLDIFITHTVDEKHFYGFITNVQLNCAQQLEEMNKAIKSIPRTAPAGICKEVGVFIDQEWYRAWVVREADPNLIVFCCDYGFSHSVPIDQTCQLPDEFWEEPPALARAFKWGSGILPQSGHVVKADVLKVEDGIPLVSLWEMM